jgi:hypothetical protein
MTGSGYYSAGAAAAFDGVVVDEDTGSDVVEASGSARAAAAAVHLQRGASTASDISIGGLFGPADLDDMGHGGGGAAESDDGDVLEVNDSGAEAAWASDLAVAAAVAATRDELTPPEAAGSSQVMILDDDDGDCGVDAGVEVLAWSDGSSGCGVSARDAVSTLAGPAESASATSSARDGGVLGASLAQPPDVEIHLLIIDPSTTTVGLREAVKAPAAAAHARGGKAAGGRWEQTVKRGLHTLRKSCYEVVVVDRVSREADIHPGLLDKAVVEEHVL